MDRTTTPPRFRVRCRSCGRTVLARVERVGDAEAVELRAHLATCRPDLPPSGRNRGAWGAWVLLTRSRDKSYG
jgi:hypothetical protein